MHFDCIFKTFFTKKTAKIALETSNLFQNVQKTFQKVRGHDQKLLETSVNMKMTKSGKIAKWTHPGA